MSEDIRSGNLDVFLHPTSTLVDRILIPAFVGAKGIWQCI